MTNKRSLRVALNGCGRIGRAFLRLALKQSGIEIVAVNDLGSREGIEYLLRHDSVYGRSDVSLNGIKYFSEKELADLPWKDLDIDVAVEATGFFTSAEKARGHIEAGAKRVVITAPFKELKESRSDLGVGERSDLYRVETVLIGLNEEKLETCEISSNASCTTNAASPIIAILDEAIGIENAVLNTVHAYTATQSLVDSPAGKKGLRESRAAASNIIPSSTGAAIAVTKAYPALEGKFDGVSLRVPVLCGSIADITFIAKRNTSAEEVNGILRGAAAAPRWQGIFAASDDEFVSSDIVGRTEASIAELSMTRVVGGNLVKVLVWYDNEVGYAETLVRHVVEAGKYV